MRVVWGLVGGFAVFGVLLFLLTSHTTPTDKDMQNNDVQVTPIHHATGVIRWGDTVVYVDPTGGAEAFVGQPAPHIVLVTDIHGDHLEPATISAVLGNAVLVVPQAVKDVLPADLAARAVVMANGDTHTEQGVTITALPMYNLPDAANSMYHPKGRGNGYLLERDGTRVYIAGDTAGTPEMRALKDIDIALIPMNLPYTMSVEEAADAVLDFKPRRVYPYHYDTSDINHFKELVHTGDPSIEVVLAEWYTKNHD